MQSFLSSIINPEGWIGWENRDSSSTMYYGEYLNFGPEASTGKRIEFLTCCSLVAYGMSLGKKMGQMGLSDFMYYSVLASRDHLELGLHGVWRRSSEISIFVSLFSFY